ncbi:MAG: hypothetical protein SF052_27770 [Bacteroidia bacterium]|nr:hypothetical protein [Bacteroidia bacterium]
MRKHNGMRPQDVVILLKVVAMGETPWRYSDIAQALHMSQSEVAEALNRSKLGRLVDVSKKKVYRESFMEFLIHGVKYVFPAQPGALVRGIPTAHSAKPLSDLLISETEAFVWPSAVGNMRGQGIVPLYPSVIKAIRKDHILYEMLALVDAIRVGKAREHNLAVETLEKMIREGAYVG